MLQKRGRLIVIEGPDGAGKTTLFNKLKENFPNYEYITFPCRSTEKGKQLDKVLKGEISLTDEEKHLLFTENRWELQEQINKFITTGITVICDRYSHSGIAYSVASGLSKEWCFEAEKGLLYPDNVIFLDVDPETCRNRIEMRKEKEEVTEVFDFQKIVYQSYKELVDDTWLVFKDNFLSNAVDVCKKSTTLLSIKYF